MFVFTLVVGWGGGGRELRPGGESGLGVGVRRGLVEASWIILQPEDPLLTLCSLLDNED